MGKSKFIMALVYGPKNIWPAMRFELCTPDLTKFCFLFHTSSVEHSYNDRDHGYINDGYNEFTVSKYCLTFGLIWKYAS